MSKTLLSINRLHDLRGAALAACMAALMASCSSSTSNPTPPGAPSIPSNPAPAGVPVPMPTPPATGAPVPSSPSTGGIPGMPAPSSPGGMPDDNGQEPGTAAPGPEPGFGDDVVAGDDLPDMRDETPASGAGSAAGELELPAAGSAGEGPAGTAGATSPGAPATGRTGNAPGEQPNPAPTAEDDPLDPNDQVAILDAELQRGEAEFDDIIRQSQEEQRRADRDNPPPVPVEPPQEQRGQVYGGGMGTSGDANTGAGTGAGTGSMPSNPAKYPPPKDIPSGDDDDVLARQLREAAMREPDPQVREKLWDEYRNYKGIEK